MRFLVFPIILSLSACSNCNIPLAKYVSQGGSEYLTTLDLGSAEYSLSFENWEPSGYENRSKENVQGNWSCAGSSAHINTKNGVTTAKYKKIGKNPLGLLETEKALVFTPSEDSILSNEVLYPLKVIK